MDALQPGTLLAHGNKLLPVVRLIWRSLSAILFITAVSGCTFDQSKGLAPTDSKLRLENVRIEKVQVKTANGRSVPFEIIYPDNASEYPLLVFSHGAFSSPDRYYAVLKPIAAAGYVVVAPMHIDSEDFTQSEEPSQSQVWESRGEDIDLALSRNPDLYKLVTKQKLKIDYDNIAVMGHSYGALIAQLAGGAKAIPPTPLRRNLFVQAVVAFSPPGSTPGLIDKDGWSSFSAPSLTITGTADILTGFNDDWKLHKHSYEYAPFGQRWLWVGEGVDHYFGGMIGREKPASEKSQLLFNRAVATTLDFLDKTLKKKAPSRLGSSISGETLTRDREEIE